MKFCTKFVYNEDISLICANDVVLRLFTKANLQIQNTNNTPKKLAKRNNVQRELNIIVLKYQSFTHKVYMFVNAK